MINYKVGEYYDGKDELPVDAFKISPSGISNFFSEKTTWYRENLLGEDKKFTGSTSTVLGTCVHHVQEIVANSLIAKEPHNSQELADAIEAYIAKYDDDEDYDTSKIRNLWYSMAEPLAKDYVLQANTIATEDFIKHELLPGIWVAGSYDAITSTVPNDDINNPVGQLTVRDYKTASKMPSTFTWAYTLQAYTYAYILHQNGVKINEVELCFAVQPTKTLPVRTKSFKKPFDDNAYKIIEGILMLVAESVQTWNDYPDCHYLLASDYRLKNT